ncbi:MAG: OmpL47-type beta-barrel domain-containing protein [Chloroflexota bacterium]
MLHSRKIFRRQTCAAASLTHSLTHSLPILLVIILLFLPVSAALAGYLGPDRTRTESDVETYDYGVWASRDDLSCNPTNDPPACIQCTWERDPFTAPCAINPPTDRYYWYKLGTRSEVITRTVTYPEAVISGALQNCSAQNGWCITSPALALNAGEPVAGYAITIIEGTRNGEAFACNGASCEVPLLEGENNFTFWALSSWGDSSRMGTLTARVDTQPPLVNGELSGTPGEAGWYVSPVTVRASAADPQPGSGIQALIYALNGGAWTPYAAPLTVSDGVHTITFRAQDHAGHTAEASASVRVDTLPPQVNTALNGEQVNGWYLSQAVFTASAEDSGSGLARIEYAPEGGAWQPYAAPVTFGGGTHTVQVRAFDQAGNASAPASLTFRVDGVAPRIQLTGAWYIWETGEVKVSDEGSGLAGIEIQIRDPQGRWQKVVRSYETSGGSFSASIAWDRTFADGTLAPVGEYDVLVKASDLAGNFAQETAHILIPAPGVTPSPLPTNTPLPSPTASVPATNAFSLPAAPIPTSTRSATVSAFQSPTRQAPITNSPITNHQSPAPLFGAAALTVIAAATAYALEQRRKRKEEEARQRAEAQREASRRNAAEEARKAQASLLAQIAAQQAAQQQTTAHRGEDAKIERMEEAEGTVLAAAKAAKPQHDEQAYQDYRAGERNAETIAADYQARKAVQEYRQGERVSYPPAPTKALPPTSKMLGDSAPIVFVVIMVTLVLLVDPWRRHGISAEPTCTGTYAACFENSERLPLTNGQTLDAQQFDEMLDAIHEDLNGKWRTPLDPGRAAYDTPFWNGNPRFGKPIYNDEVVCLNDKCSERSAINYVAQGMYSAHTGQSLEDAKELANRWNKWIWRHDATQDELYWLEYGYKAEQERNTMSP